MAIEWLWRLDRVNSSPSDLFWLVAADLIDIKLIATAKCQKQLKCDSFSRLFLGPIPYGDAGQKTVAAPIQTTWFHSLIHSLKLISIQSLSQNSRILTKFWLLSLTVSNWTIDSVKFCFSPIPIVSNSQPILVTFVSYLQFDHRFSQILLLSANFDHKSTSWGQRSSNSQPILVTFASYLQFDDHFYQFWP